MLAESTTSAVLLLCFGVVLSGNSIVWAFRHVAASKVHAMLRWNPGVQMIAVSMHSAGCGPCDVWHLVVHRFVIVF